MGSSRIQSIRGMSDILPECTPYWHHLEALCRSCAQSYGYQEVRFPVVETTQLFKRAVGAVTDIVEKEMYTFSDRNGDSLSLRPEGTASCVRAALQSGLLHNQVQRLWYLGPMFRHERPQKGRYRQFHQFGVEAFGFPSCSVEVEQLLLAKSILNQLGLLDQVELQINTLGSFESRQQYRERLVAYFSQYKDSLDEDSLRRLQSNPLRILDSKNPGMADLIQGAPQLLAHLDSASQQHFDQFCSLLDAVKLKYTINSNLVRGLDYYCHSVYEWVTTQLGAQGTVCAGGRYDGLVEKLGGKSTPASGFAMGLERLILLFQQQQELVSSVDAYVVCLNDEAVRQGVQLAEHLRSSIPNFNVTVDLSGGSVKSQFKKADKSRARYALILAEDELLNRTVTLKFLREDRPQETLKYPELIEFFLDRR